MPELILTPNSDEVNTLSVIPLLRPNFECVYLYPIERGDISYVYVDNGNGADHYGIIGLVATQNFSISNVTSHALCKKENDTQVCTVENNIRIPGGPVANYGTAYPLTESFELYSYSWSADPDNYINWTIGNIIPIWVGLRLVSGGAGCEAQCTQCYLSLDVTILGEKVSNNSSYQPSDVVHVNQDYSVIAKEDQGRILFGSTTVQIKYKDPDGVEGTLTGDIIDQNAVVAPMPAATNNKTGKWWFKLYTVLAGGEILEGVPFFTNVQPEWV